MPKWESTSKRNASRVQSLFDQIRQVAPGSADSGWLRVLEQDARNRKRGWRERFDAWLRGQEQAGGVSAADANEWRRGADACFATGIHPEPVVFCLLWTLLVTVATLAWQTTLVGRPQAVVGCAVIALTGVIWAQRAGWLVGQGRPLLRRCEQGLIAFVVGVGAIVIGVIAPGIFSECVKEGTYQAFVRQQKEFTRASAGYPWIRDFSQREFGVDIVMNAPENAWVRTTLQTVGASPAFMSTGNGLCELSISRESILNTVAAPGSQAVDAWLQGVMMHELAHCLDVRRDYEGQGGAWTGTRSIAPVDRHKVDSGSSHYRVASERQPTQLWREAVADMMAVGYWRLNVASGEGSALTAALRAKRQASSKQDRVHATMCWIDFAASANGPSSNQQLFSWADELRSASSCKTAPD